MCLPAQCFVEKLAGKERYRFKGKVRKMDCRTETFKYTEASAMKSVNRRICRTVHGPVQATSRGYAFARRYAIWGRELETLEGLAGIASATCCTSPSATTAQLDHMGVGRTT